MKIAQEKRVEVKSHLRRCKDGTLAWVKPHTRKFPERFSEFIVEEPEVDFSKRVPRR